MLDLLGRNVDLIVLAPYLQILGPDFVAQYLFGHNQYPEMVPSCPRLARNLAA
jgi:folate-dependent phosphoribosylglycinamide formyltransferase PurN